MTEGRDRQRSKLYAWEERFVAPHDASSITFAQAQGMVDAIWAEMGCGFRRWSSVFPARPAPSWLTGQSAVHPAGEYQPVLVAPA